MRYIRYIKANLISSLKSFPALLLMVLMPFLLALFLAFSTKSAFNPSDLNIETKIYIIIKTRVLMENKSWRCLNNSLRKNKLR